MSLLTNIRFALRLLRKSPAFTFTVLLTLGLCIGANTAIYSVVDALFFRPLPYPNPDRLVMIARHVSGSGFSGIDVGQSGRAWQLIHDHATLLTPAVYGDNGGVNLYANGRNAYVQQQRIGAGFFHVLGVKPLLGREFKPSEDVPGGPAVTVLSYAAWQRFLHGDPSALGSTIDLRGAPITVIGVMPAGFHTDAPADFWTPLQPFAAGEGDGENYQIIARLQPGVTLADATGQLTAIMKPLLQQRRLKPGRTVEESAVPLEAAESIDNQRGTNYRHEAKLLWAAALLVLLIGCVNIAGLLLARAATRRREITTRLALGASRATVIRQLLIESLLLAAGGGLLGVFLGQFTTEALSYLSAQQFDFWTPVRFNAPVGFVSFGVALLTGLLFGLFPALQATSVDLRSGLAEAGRTAAGHRRQRSRQALVFAEVALGVVIVVSAGLLLRTLGSLMNLDPGFDSQNVTTASLSLNDARYQTSASGARLFKDALDRIRQIPGVESAAATISLPYTRPFRWGGIRIVGRPAPPNSGTNLAYITPDLLTTLRIPLLRGRAFSDADTVHSQQVVIVNPAFLDRFLPRTENPLGEQVKFDGRSFAIVGVVQNVLQKGDWDEAPGPTPMLYLPVAQCSDQAFQEMNTFFSPSFVIRTRGPIAGLNHALERAIAAVDPRLPLSSFQNMSEVRGTALSQQRYLTVLFSTLAGLALLLAAIGIYGLIAQSVAERTREMGIRLALGATANNIVRQTAAPGILLSAAGVACGLLLSAFATRLLTSFIWRISSTDPVTYVAVALLLLAVAAMASLLPALRLTRIDPAQTLRDE